MTYAKIPSPQKTNENNHGPSGDKAARKLPAIPVLQRAEPEENEPMQQKATCSGQEHATDWVRCSAHLISNEINNNTFTNSVVQEKNNKQGIGPVNNSQDAIAKRKTESLINSDSVFQLAQTAAIGKSIPHNTSIGTIQLLTTAQILTISPENKQFVQEQFGDNTQKIMELAPNTETLKKWTLIMRDLNVVVGKAKYKVDNPPLTGATEADQIALIKAQAARTAKLTEILSTAPTTTTPVWRASSSSSASSTYYAVPDTEATPAEPAEKLPKVTTVTTDYNPHGDYNPSSGSQIKASGIVAYVIENHDQFVYRGPVFGGEGYQMYLGDIGMSSWYITVTLKKDGSAIITHFGPFGEKTTTSIEKKSRQ